MKNNIYKLGLLLITQVLMLSCNSIHKFPGDDPVDPTWVDVNVKFKVSASMLTEDLPSAVTSRTIGQNQVLRTIVEVYRVSAPGVCVERREIISDKTDPMQVSVSELFKLDVAKYKIVAWMDYVDKQVLKDQYHKTSLGLTNVRFVEPFVSNTDQRDCFSGSVLVDLEPYKDKLESKVVVEDIIYRHVAKYTIIANDVEKYITRTNTKGETKTEEDINRFTAKITYQGYMPISFDVATNKPNDAKIGLEYTASLSLINGKEAMICFDYPLVNGPSSMTSVSMRIFDENGVLINEVGDVHVPLTRDKLTVVRGEYLTRTYSPGVSIDPSYNGEFEIIIPD